MKRRRKQPETREAHRQYQKNYREKSPEQKRTWSREAQRKFCSDGRPKMYFIQAASGPVKIGFTTKRIEGRLQELQVGNHEELTVLLVVAATREEEYRTHLRFEHLLIRGEWFRPAKELLAFIASITT